jgi:hypothetical protein
MQMEGKGVTALFGACKEAKRKFVSGNSGRRAVTSSGMLLGVLVDAIGRRGHHVGNFAPDSPSRWLRDPHIRFSSDSR